MMSMFFVALLFLVIHVYIFSRLMFIQSAGRSCLHMVQLWKSDAQLASQRLPAIHFLVHECSANINIQVTDSRLFRLPTEFLFHWILLQKDSSNLTMSGIWQKVRVWVNECFLLVPALLGRPGWRAVKWVVAVVLMMVEKRVWCFAVNRKVKVATPYYTWLSSRLTPSCSLTYYKSRPSILIFWHTVDSQPLTSPTCLLDVTWFGSWWLLLGNTPTTMCQTPAQSLTMWVANDCLWQGRSCSGFTS